VWVQIGNCTTSDVERTLRRHPSDLEVLDLDPAVAFLIIN